MKTDNLAQIRFSLFPKVQVARQLEWNRFVQVF